MMKMTFDANPTEVYGWHEEKANRKFIEDWLLRMAFDPEDAALYAQKLIDLEKKSFKARVNFLEDIGEGIDRLLLRDRKADWKCMPSTSAVATTMIKLKP